MKSIDIRLLGPGRCRITHVPSSVEMNTAMPPEYGGSGDAFSSTDLVAAALGSCIATSLQSLLAGAGIGDSDLSVSVRKTLSMQPKGIARLDVTIGCGAATTGKLRSEMLAAAQTSPVYRALNPAIVVTVHMQ